MAELEEQTARSRYFLDAFSSLAGGLRPRPQPRYLFDDAVAKGRIFWSQLLRAHDAVIDGGQELTKALAFARALDGYVRCRVAARDGVGPVLSLKSALRDGSWMDAHNDVARTEALVEPTPATLRTFIESADREIAALEQARRLAQLQIAQMTARISA